MVEPHLYRTVNGFFEYYAYAIETMRQKYGALQHYHGPYALDHWMNAVEPLTESLLNKANEYGLTVTQALAPIVFMDDWIRYNFPHVKNWSDEYEEIWLPLHLFSQVNTDPQGNPTVWTRIVFTDYILELVPEEITAYSNDWFLVLVRKKAKEGETPNQPVYEITNNLSNGSAIHTQQPFMLDDYVDKMVNNRMGNPYGDSFGIRTQLYVKACRIKALTKHITVTGALTTRYKNTRIDHSDEAPGGSPSLETQKAIFVNTLFRIPVITCTFVIV